MTDSQVVAFTTCNRPGYLRRVLDSWENVRGIDKAQILVRAEPGCPEVHQMAREAFSGRAEVHVNPNRLGEADNQHAAIEAGFATGARFVILAEDDNLVSTDVLEYFAWADGYFADRPEVITVCTFRHHRIPGGPAGVGLFDGFQVNTWGIWRDRWEDLIRDDWPRHKAEGWDWRITRHWCGDLGYRTALPCEARCQNIGEFGGVHGDGPRAQSDCWTVDIPPQEYYEVPA